MKIAFIGHSVAIRNCIEILQHTPNEVVAIFTHPKEGHQRDLAIYEERKELFGDYAYDVFDAFDDYGIPVIEYQDLSQKTEIDQLKSYDPQAVITVGCRDILKANFIEQFEHVFNLHPYFLPYYRGAGIDSWLILQGQSPSTQYATCHYISPRIDAGKIIATLPYAVPDNAKPIDIFKVRMDTLGPLLIKALDNITSDQPVYSEQDESQSMYYPRLNTLRDGKIEFSQWGGQEISLFIRAFSYPYEGAWFLLNAEKVHVHESSFTPLKNIHPYGVGLIVRKDTTGIFVMVKDGLIKISALVQNGDDFDLKKIKIGKRICS